MTVKDILKNVAKLLSLEDEYEAMENYDFTLNQSVGDVVIEEDTLREIDLLKTLFNLVNNMIATNYIEILNTELVVCNGFIRYADINGGVNILGIRKVVDKSGNQVTFDLDYDGIKISKGEYYITYAVYPRDLGVDDEINMYPIRISDKVFIYGVMSEYLLIKGNTTEAVTFDARFKQLLFDIVRPRHEIRLPTREWS